MKQRERSFKTNWKKRIESKFGLGPFFIATPSIFKSYITEEATNCFSLKQAKGEQSN